MVRTLLPCLLVASVAFLPLPPAQDEVTIETVPVTDGVSMLVGQGGNIGVSVGDDGAFLVDDQFAPLTDQIVAAVGELTTEPIRFLVNTHWHGDHTGGNENMGNKGVLLVAHQNVRERMSVEQVMEAFGRTVPPSPEVALPKITFTEAVTFHWNGDEVHVFHVRNAHTDGDAIVHFRKADVLHMGDVYFNGFYPFIDASSGGGIGGVVAAVDEVLGVCGEDTRIIPGHGPLSDTDELRAYRDMLADVRDRMQALIDQGLSRDEIVAAKPTAHLDAIWGKGFFAPDDWVGVVYDGMK